MANRQTTTASRSILASLLGFSLAGVSTPSLSESRSSDSAKPTEQQAEDFVRAQEKRLLPLVIDSTRAQWVADNFITDDTEAMTAQAQANLLRATGEAALQARKYNGLKVSGSTGRKLKLLQLSVNFSDDTERELFTHLAASMEGAYGKAKYCPKQADGSTGTCLPIGDLESLFAESRDPAQLKDAWLGWHAQSKAYKDDYVKYVALSNKGAREMGYADTGVLWRSGYDMTPEQFADELERVWQQVKPLYESLHTYSRYKLRQQYGAGQVPLTGPIPAHLFGNMWSQSWSNLYPVLKPAEVKSDYDLGNVLGERKVGPQEMVRYAERFYESLGMPALPGTFWERSLLTKPQDREVVCHASAWDIDQLQDVRVKMCIRPTEEDFTTIHHELGHVYYFLAYRDLPVLFRAGANDGFHEAIGDTIALSVTPDYLKRIGLMNPSEQADDDIDIMLRQALGKVAFLPFAYLVDRTCPARGLRQELVAVARALPGHQPPGADSRGRIRCRREVPRRRGCSVRPLFRRAHVAVPVPPRAVPCGRFHGSAASMLDLRELGRRRETSGDAEDGRQQALARSAEVDDRRRPHGRRCAARIFRTAEAMARSAEQGAGAGGSGGRAALVF
jgi:peptidyl-dipeptidase A